MYCHLKNFNYILCISIVVLEMRSFFYIEKFTFKRKLI